MPREGPDADIRLAEARLHRARNDAVDVGGHPVDATDPARTDTQKLRARAGSAYDTPDQARTSRPLEPLVLSAAEFHGHVQRVHQTGADPM